MARKEINPNKLTVKEMKFDFVEHDVKVTRMPGLGYGVRVFVNGKLSSECIADCREMVGPTIRDLLRMEDKCGNISKMADRSRHRTGEKEYQRKLAAKVAEIVKEQVDNLDI